MLAERSLTQEKIRKRLGETNVLIWDEVSMTSKRILELVNIIHHLLSDNNFAFGGIQVILVGDFWQLKPIPSVFDDGKAIYESHIFNDVFQHRIELTKILRQSECETSFKDLLEMLRVGDCSDEAEEYARSLNREITAPDGNELVHIYFKKIHVEHHNGTVLASLPGELIQYQSIDTGHTTSLEKSIPRVLAVKPRCKIMLLYNNGRT
jgi:ATP-dependent DNA helicase PIF1